MSTTHQDKSGGKPRPRKGKADQRSRKPDQPQSPKLDQRQAEEKIGATVGSTVAPTTGTVTPADSFPVSIQNIANAYSDYTRKSLEETTSFVEKLTGVRSLDKAIEIQAEFAKQAYETFVAESQRICELYSELAKQIFKPFAGLLAKATHSGR